MAWFSAHLSIRDEGIREEIRVAVTIGLLGGFTTFSAFSKESLLLLQQGRMGTCALYVALSVILSILAVWGGSKLVGLSASPITP